MEGFKTQGMKEPKLRSTTKKSLQFDSTLNRSAGEKPIAQVSPMKLTLSMATLLPTAAVHTSPRFVSPVPEYYLST